MRLWMITINHFHELLDDVNDFRETVTKMDAI